MKRLSEHNPHMRQVPKQKPDDVLDVSEPLAISASDDSYDASVAAASQPQRLQGVEPSTDDSCEVSVSVLCLKRVSSC